MFYFYISRVVWGNRDAQTASSRTAPKDLTICHFNRNLLWFYAFIYCLAHMLSCCKQTSGFFSDKRVSLWRVYEVMCFFCKSSSRVWMCRDLWLNVNSEQPPKFRKNTSFLLYSHWPMQDTLMNIQYFWTWAGFFFSDTGVFCFDLCCVVNWLSEKPQMKIILAHWDDW